MKAEVNEELYKYHSSLLLFQREQTADNQQYIVPDVQPGDAHDVEQSPNMELDFRRQVSRSSVRVQRCVCELLLLRNIANNEGAPR